MARNVSRPRRKKVKKVSRAPAKKPLRFSDDKIEALWDKRVTPKRNSKRLGIAIDLNSEDAIKRKDDLETKLLADLGERRTEEIKAFMRPINPNRSRFHIPPAEREYLEALETKYGDDTYEMYRDLKLNYLQYSQQKLSSRLARLHRLQEEEKAEKEKE